MAEKKILIIDNDIASRNFIAHSLIDNKFDVIQAASGKEGLIFSWRDRPDLIIIDPVIPDLSGEEFAIKIRQDSRTTNVPLIALSSDPMRARLRSCLDAGFNQYINKSGQAVPSLIETVNKLLGIVDQNVQQGGLLIVFLSAKGGAGTSSLCSNIATSLSVYRPQASVAVIDMVLPIGSIGPIVDYHGRQNIVNIADLPLASTGPNFFKDHLPDIKPWRFNLLAGSTDPESSNHLNVARIWDIVSSVRQAYDFVLVDLGRSLSKFSLPLIQHADLIALVISTDLSSVKLTETLLDYLKAKGIKETAIYTILNRAISLEGLSKTEAEKVLSIPIKTAIPYLGSNLATANNQHQPYSTKFPNDTASVIFMDAARQISALTEKQRVE